MEGLDNSVPAIIDAFSSALGSLLNLAFSVVIIAAQAKLFMKAGREWWEAIIPYYSFYVMCDIVKQKKKFFKWLISNIVMGAMIPIIIIFFIAAASSYSSHIYNNLSINVSTGFGFAMVITFLIASAASIVCMVIKYKIYASLAEDFGKSRAYGILLFLFPIIFFPIFGFDKNIKYVGVKEEVPMNQANNGSYQQQYQQNQYPYYQPPYDYQYNQYPPNGNYNQYSPNDNAKNGNNNTPVC